VKQFRWIVFDAVGTLIEATPGVATAYRDVGRRFGADLSLDEVRQRFRAAFAQTETRDLGDTVKSTGQRGIETSEEIEEQRWRRIVAEVLPEASDLEACFQELFEHFSRPESWRCFEDVTPCFDWLRGTDSRLAVASNFDARLHIICDRLPPLPALERRFVSSEVGFRKPAPEFFEVVLEALECRADEVLFVGDDLTNDIVGPRSVGMPAVLLDRGQAPDGCQTDDVLRIRSLTELIDRTSKDRLQELRV
jgi:putative hydrolase of the HAD superfamily